MAAETTVKIFDSSIAKDETHTPWATSPNVATGCTWEIGSALSVATVGSDNGESFVNTGGSTNSTNNRYVKVTIPDGFTCKFYIKAAANGNNGSRYAFVASSLTGTISNAVGNSLVTSTSKTDIQDVTSTSLSNGIYYLCFNQSVNLYDFHITLIPPTPVAPTVSIPATLTAAIGESSYIQATISGVPTPDIKWYSCNADKSNAKEQSCTKASFGFKPSVAGTRYYYCEVTNTLGTVASDVCTVTVVPKHSVTYNLNDGTGTTPTQANVMETASFTLATSAGITAPAGLALYGWNDGSKTYTAGSSYTMGTTDVTLNAVWGKSVTLINAELNGGTNAPTVTGNLAGSAVAKTQSSPSVNGGYKFDSNCYVGLTLANGATFKKGDVLHVNITDANSGGKFLAIYSDQGLNLICVSTIKDQTGDVTFTLTDDFNGKSTFYLYRSGDYAWNAYVANVSVEGLVEALPVTIGSALYSTFSAPYATTIPSGVTAYGVAVKNNSTVTLTEIEDGVIPANTGVILNGEAGTYTFVATATAGSASSVLTPSLAETEIAAADYVLGNGSNGVGFYHLEEGNKLAANKAYLPASAIPAGAKFVGFNFGDDVTAVAGVAEAKASVKVAKFMKNGQLLIKIANCFVNAAGAQVK